MTTSLILWIAQKTAEIILGKLLEKLLSTINLEYLVKFLKFQILVLYLKWILLKTPMISPTYEEKDTSINKFDR